MKTEGEYPTDRQVEEFFSAYEKDGKAGILAQLERAREQRQALIASQNGNEAVCAQPVETASLVQTIEHLQEQNLRLEQEKRSNLLYQLKESYRNPGDKFVWGIVIWLVSFCVLAPFVAVRAAFFTALFVTLAWAGIHKAEK